LQRIGSCHKLQGKCKCSRNRMERYTVVVNNEECHARVKVTRSLRLTACLLPGIPVSWRNFPMLLSCLSKWVSLWAWFNYFYLPICLFRLLPACPTACLYDIYTYSKCVFPSSRLLLLVCLSVTYLSLWTPAQYNGLLPSALRLTERNQSLSYVNVSF